MIFEVSNRGSLMFATYLEVVRTISARYRSGRNRCLCSRNNEFYRPGDFQRVSDSAKCWRQWLCCEGERRWKCEALLQLFRCGRREPERLGHISGQGVRHRFCGKFRLSYEKPISADLQELYRKRCFRQCDQSGWVGANDLVYSTFLGGSGLDQGMGVAVDKTSGNIYVAGVSSLRTSRYYHRSERLAARKTAS